VSTIAAGILIPLLLVLQLVAVFQTSSLGDFKPITQESLILAETQLSSDIGIESQIRKELKSGSLPDVNLIGQKLFTEYNFLLQVIGILLLVATIGCVSLSKKLKTKE
jgi:NADH-quinone oxidoreductase subunit J